MKTESEMNTNGERDETKKERKKEREIKPTHPGDSKRGKK